MTEVAADDDPSPRPRGTIGLPFERDALARGILAAARGLLGARLVRDEGSGRRVARVVEVEAYDGEADHASHARVGRTARNGVMWGPPGVAYVYLVYGMYDCLNVVAEPEGRPAAILVRAVAPLEGIELMRRSRLSTVAARRRLDADGVEAEARRLAALPAQRLASGPGLVAAAFGLDRTWTGTDVCGPGSPLRLERRPAGEPAPAVAAGPRIGIAYAGEPWRSRPWRFVVVGDPAVSGGLAARPATRPR